MRSATKSSGEQGEGFGSRRRARSSRYRRAVALFRLGDLEAARADLLAARESSPEDSWTAVEDALEAVEAGRNPRHPRQSTNEERKENV